MRLVTTKMPTDMDRSRSRSPYRGTESPRKRKRSRSPRRHHSAHKSKAPSTPVILPLGALPLTRHDLKTYRPMFALYLDIQKQKYIEDLSEDEVKGRWKSFIGKWYASRNILPLYHLSYEASLLANIVGIVENSQKAGTIPKHYKRLKMEQIRNQ